MALTMWPVRHMGGGDANGEKQWHVCMISVVLPWYVGTGQEVLCCSGGLIVYSILVTREELAGAEHHCISSYLAACHGMGSAHVPFPCTNIPVKHFKNSANACSHVGAHIHISLHLNIDTQSQSMVVQQHTCR